MTIPQAFDLALSHHHAGRLAEAEALYGQILAAQPNHAGALHFLGVIALQAGRHDLAVDLIRKAIFLDPNDPAAHSNLGEACRRIGRLDEAIAAFHRALELKPGSPETHNNLGAALRARGRVEEAITAYRHALALKPNYPEAHNNLGNALAGKGQLDEAMAAYHRAIELSPGYPEAHNNLGAELLRQGHLDQAIAAFRRALEFEPDYPGVHLGLGIALKRRGRLDEAVASYRRALELEPNGLAAHLDLGVTLRERGRLDEAVTAYRRALDRMPGSWEIHNNLGVTLVAQGRLDEAIAAYRQALKLRPDSPDVCANLAGALRDQGQSEEAMALDRRAIELRPDFSQAHNHLGNALMARGQFDEAVAAYRNALKFEPDDAEAHYNLGAALMALGQSGEAICAYRRAIEIKPGWPEPHNNLGIALWDQRQLDEAIAAYRRGIELNPDSWEIRSNLGGMLAARGQLDEALATYRAALKMKPDDAGTHSNLIYTLHFHPDQSDTTIAIEHRRWNRQFCDEAKPFIRPHSNDRNPGRRLRVGYISPDFRDHPIGRFVLPLFKRHDRKQFEIFCYSEVARADWMTERLRALVEAAPIEAGARWRSTVGVSNARLSEMIREDGVDILVDLASHTADNRLPVFARQPAPVQVTWLAYPGSTGLDSIGYRLTDAHIDPPGEKPAWSAEEPVRLPDSWCCYDPASESPDVNPLPALSAKRVTFGSLNNLIKINERVLALWSRVLETVGKSKLVMFCPEGSAREWIWGFFAARGIAVERVELVGFLPRWEYLSLYQRIDIGLDPFPCNGMTTTCDALWMGAPVLTLSGSMPVSRTGLSLLSSVGLTEFVASSEDDYIQMAVALSSDLLRLAELRAALRRRMQTSPLMDAPRFARNVEAAYRSMWQAWRLHQ